VSANSNDVARQLGDFDWDVQPEDGYPVIALDDANGDSEVFFKYNYTGTLSSNKYLDSIFRVWNFSSVLSRLWLSQ
jgi:hypothetical protein